MDYKKTKDATIITPRELEVMRLLAKGLSSNKIAKEMHLSPDTIIWYRKGLHLKFDVHSTAELLVKAMEQDLL